MLIEEYRFFWKHIGEAITEQKQPGEGGVSTSRHLECDGGPLFEWAPSRYRREQVLTAA